MTRNYKNTIYLHFMGRISITKQFLAKYSNFLSSLFSKIQVAIALPRSIKTIRSVFSVWYCCLFGGKWS